MIRVTFTEHRTDPDETERYGSMESVPGDRYLTIAVFDDDQGRPTVVAEGGNCSAAALRERAHAALDEYIATRRVRRKKRAAGAASGRSRRQKNTTLMEDVRDLRGKQPSITYADLAKQLFPRFGTRGKKGRASDQRALAKKISRLKK
jgi:hypothetical protein